MTIYHVMCGIAHNKHYLNRYIRYIESCKEANANFTGYVERHHICPKADDMFPQYASFEDHPWNCALLSARQHYVAHLLLWKAFPDIASNTYALWFMTNGKWKEHAYSSKTYARLRGDFINVMSTNASVKQLALVAKAVMLSFSKTTRANTPNQGIADS